MGNRAAGSMFRADRLARGWTQVQAAARLGISQTYVSLIESGRRPIPPALFRLAQRAMDLPVTALPLGEVRSLDPDALARAVGGLRYPPFAHLRRRLRLNPAEILVSAPASPSLEARLAEALPWIGREFWDLDWDWTAAQAKLRDVQNRLGYVVTMARRTRNPGLHLDPRAPQTVSRPASLERSALSREPRGRASISGQDVSRGLSAAASCWAARVDPNAGKHEAHG